MRGLSCLTQNMGSLDECGRKNIGRWFSLERGFGRLRLPASKIFTARRFSSLLSPRFRFFSLHPPHPDPRRTKLSKYGFMVSGIDLSSVITRAHHSYRYAASAFLVLQTSSLTLPNRSVLGPRVCAREIWHERSFLRPPKHTSARDASEAFEQSIFRQVVGAGLYD